MIVDLLWLYLVHLSLILIILSLIWFFFGLQPYLVFQHVHYLVFVIGWFIDCYFSLISGYLIFIVLICDCLQTEVLEVFKKIVESLIQLQILLRNNDHGSSMEQTLKVSYEEEFCWIMILLLNNTNLADVIQMLLNNEQTLGGMLFF